MKLTHVIGEKRHQSRKFDPLSQKHMEFLSRLEFNKSQNLINRFPKTFYAVSIK